MSITKEKGTLEVMNFNLLNSEFYIRFLSAFILFLALISIFFLGELFIKIGLFLLSLFLFYELEQLSFKRNKLNKNNAILTNSSPRKKIEIKAKNNTKAETNLK